MSKQEVVSSIHEELETSLNRDQIGRVVEAIFSTLSGLDEGERFRVTGFGTFEVKKRKARTGRNPKTGDAITIPESNTMTFRIAKDFKDAIQPKKAAPKAKKGGGKKKKKR